MIYSIMVRRIGEILKEARAKTGLSQRQLAIQSGVSRQLINFLESGKRDNATSETIIALAKTLNINPGILLGEEDSTESSKKIAESIKEMIRTAASDLKVEELIKLPMKGFIPCGTPFPVEEETGDVVEVLKTAIAGIPAESLYALIVSGDSLKGDEIYSGQAVIVNFKDTEIVNDKIYVVRIGNEVTAKHVTRLNDHLRLYSSNEEYKDILAKDVEVLGRIVLSGGRWKKQ